MILICKSTHSWKLPYHFVSFLLDKCLKWNTHVLFVSLLGVVNSRIVFHSLVKVFKIRAGILGYIMASN